MDKRFTSVEVNLLLVAKLREGDQIYVRGDKIYVEERWLITPLRRFLYGHGRDASVLFLRDLYAEAEMLMKNPMYLDRIRECVTKSEKGLHDFFSTYSGDRRTMSEFESLCGIIDRIRSMKDVE